MSKGTRKPLSNSQSSSAQQWATQVLSILENTQRGGIEILFDAEPLPQLQSKLRVMGYRNSRTKNMWYGEKTDNAAAFADQVKAILQDNPEGPDLSLSPSVDALEINLEKKAFSFVMFTLKNGQTKSYVLFEPSKPRAEVIAANFARERFGKELLALAVMPKTQIRNARILFNGGMIIYPDGLPPKNSKPTPETSSTENTTLLSSEQNEQKLKVRSILLTTEAISRDPDFSAGVELQTWKEANAWVKSKIGANVSDVYYKVEWINGSRFSGWVDLEPSDFYDGDNEPLSNHIRTYLSNYSKVDEQDPFYEKQKIDYAKFLLQNHLFEDLPEGILEKPLRKSQSKIPIKHIEITVHRNEGAPDYDRGVNYYNWKAANDELRWLMGKESNVYFRLSWDDGEAYEGSTNVEQSEFYEDQLAPFSWFLNYYFKFLSNQKASVLYSKKQIERAAYLLAGYQLEDALVTATEKENVSEQKPEIQNRPTENVRQLESEALDKFYKWAVQQSDINSKPRNVTREQMGVWFKENQPGLSEKNIDNIWDSHNRILARLNNQSKVRRRSPFHPFDAIYKKILKVIPNLIEHIKEGKTAGKSKVDPEGGLMALNFDFLYYDRNGNPVIALSHYFEQQGDMVADPDMQIRLIPEMQSAEAMTFQDQRVYQEVYSEKDGKQYVNTKLKNELNRFLNQWLTNIIEQGHTIDLAEVSADESDEESDEKPSIAVPVAPVFDPHVMASLIASQNYLANAWALSHAKSVLQQHTFSADEISQLKAFFAIYVLEDKPMQENYIALYKSKRSHTSKEKSKISGKDPAQNEIPSNKNKSLNSDQVDEDTNKYADITDPLATENGVYTSSSAGANFEELVILMPNGSRYSARIYLVRTSAGTYKIGISCGKTFGDYSSESYYPSISGESYPSRSAALRIAIEIHMRQLQNLLDADDSTLNNEEVKRKRLSLAIDALKRYQKENALGDEINPDDTPSHQQVQLPDPGIVPVIKSLDPLATEDGAYTSFSAGRNFETLQVPMPKSSGYHAEVFLVKTSAGTFREGICCGKHFGDISYHARFPNVRTESYSTRKMALKAGLLSLEMELEFNLSTKDTILNNEATKHRKLTVAMQALKLFAKENGISLEAKPDASEFPEGIIPDLEAAYWTQEDAKYPANRVHVKGQAFHQSRLRTLISNKLESLSLPALEQIRIELANRFHERRPIQNYDQGLITIGKKGEAREAALIALYVDDMILDNDFKDNRETPVMSFLFDVLFQGSSRLVDVPKDGLNPKGPGKPTKKQSQFELNKDIEKFIDHTDDAGGFYNEEEKNYLRQYTGSGGLSQDGATGRGTLYEYYTPEAIVRKMWDIAHHYGYDGGSILEPAVGTGNFLKYAPSNASVVGYETNHYAARIAQILYPNSLIHEKAFESHFFAGNKHLGDKFERPGYSLAIGNPPYGAFSGKYAGLGEKVYTGAKEYDQYFILRSLDLLKRRGLLVFLIPSYFMLSTQKYNNVKKRISAYAEWIDAYRLPGDAFPNTQIGTDILVLRKR